MSAPCSLLCAPGALLRSLQNTSQSVNNNKENTLDALSHRPYVVLPTCSPPGPSPVAAIADRRGGGGTGVEGVGGGTLLSSPAQHECVWRGIKDACLFTCDLTFAYPKHILGKH